MAKLAKTDLIDRGDSDWYRDAVIYQLHVKAFYDANNDGIGDFEGLVRKLDYLQDLGVTAIWLLPFYPSPLRDDGYDIAEYRAVNPSYGRMRDLRALIRECHRRNMRVITELVINHTSDQHPWFQRARHAKPGSSHRNFYVWSDTDQKYLETRIIFLDTETSNWAWDPVAQAYYWHRFYSHQPDLNFDNPQVLRQVVNVLRFWLDMGVDGLRLDAVPYLIEREGTNNENLPETHDILKRIRAAMDARYPDRMLLAEANQWPEDVRAYFGDGDECHIAFHFPLMPRMYVAIAQEDRHPITDIMRQTPEIPEICQWAIFLRNHDELTLEMVTDRERDYLWNFYASDRRMRLNLGIRRRLAPLMGNDRRKIELMTALLLSMAGTPILYYGDEIGMGDNVFLGDRDGVRTPMQWSPDRNGGFSRADPAQLYLPPIMDPIYGYEAVNVEAQTRNATSHLNWTKRMIAVRQTQRVFGRGSLEFLYPSNRKVLAFLREYEGTIVLCVYNLSRAAQAVELDLSRLRGRTPVELTGRSAFPPVGDLPYLLTLPGHGFYWFVLADQQDLPSWYEPLVETAPEFVTLVLRRGWQDLLERPARALLEDEALPGYLAKQRWFAAKDDRISSTRVLSAASLADGGDQGYLLLEVEAVLASGQRERYGLPVTTVPSDPETNRPILPFMIARVRRGANVGGLYDAVAINGFPLALMDAMRERLDLPLEGGHIRFTATEKLDEIELSEAPEVRRLGVEQSNSSILIDDHVMLKLYRKLSPGIHPELEIGRFLTRVGYANTPPLLGAVERLEEGGTVTALAIAQGYVRNQGDGWSHALDRLGRRLEEAHLGVEPGGEDAAAPSPDEIYPLHSATLGQRTAELHRALASDTRDKAFAPEPVRQRDLRAWRSAARRQAEAAFRVLGRAHKTLSGSAAQSARELAARRRECFELIDALAQTPVQATKTRV
ncbi:MAG TPA: maltose alpha-D-glucosyltransferase, partial [Kiloniellales bacterium]|nr:maltose alpha-D-glucosyltransferase [Kiloniellales bacterium]